mmetsp:Transcript_7264/g.11405  ORF Transcript_7264/g.11405 Transcript_7264/m.11405 type:complete len:152 (+) Transcript_7264:1088-1543(+)
MTRLSMTGVLRTVWMLIPTGRSRTTSLLKLLLKRQRTPCLPLNRISQRKGSQRRDSQLKDSLLKANQLKANQLKDNLLRGSQQSNLQKDNPLLKNSLLPSSKLSKPKFSSQCRLLKLPCNQRCLLHKLSSRHLLLQALIPPSSRLLQLLLR